MKTTAVTLAVLSAFATAQQLGDIPSCGNVCAQNMLANDGTREIPDCDAGDLACLCASPMFIYGLRDCAGATCEGLDANQVVEAGIEACSSAGVVVTDAASGTQASSATATTTIGSSSGAGDLVSTVTSDGTAIVTTLSTSGGLGDAFTSAIESVSSNIDSISSQIGSLTSGMSSVTATTDGGASETNGGNGDDNGDGGDNGGDGNGGDGNGDGNGDGGDGGDGDGGNDEDAAFQLTAAPAGIIVAAGLAALML